MSRQAFGTFEKDGSTGDWVCVKSTTFPLKSGGASIPIAEGQRFHPHSTFAGYDDFTAQLDAVAVDAPRIAPHETT